MTKLITISQADYDLIHPNSRITIQPGMTLREQARAVNLAKHYISNNYGWAKRPRHLIPFIPGLIKHLVHNAEGVRVYSKKSFVGVLVGLAIQLGLNNGVEDAL